MNRRLTETTKWRDPWFNSLTVVDKLLWMYICDTCDQVGVFEWCQSIAEVEIGSHVDFESFLQVAGEGRVRRLTNGKYHICKFAAFQEYASNEGCLRANNYGLSVLRLAASHGISLDDWGVNTSKAADFREKKEKISRTSSNHQPNIPRCSKDKDKDKDKDKEKEKEREPNKEESPIEVWLEYVRMRDGSLTTIVSDAIRMDFIRHEGKFDAGARVAASIGANSRHNFVWWTDLPGKSGGEVEFNF